jgi:CMP-N-acetylneuraminic acid synthetase
MIVAIIPAKGGSSRLPNKNIAPLNGRPMMDYTIMEAKRSKRIDEIYVSTDNDEIAENAEKNNVKVIRRPSSLGGDVPIVDVYRHAIEQLNNPDIKIVIGLQPDHPDRDMSVDEVLKIFEEEGVDRLLSEEADSTKNGAHFIMSRHFVDTDEIRKEIYIVDDCTNVHYQADLEAASSRLIARNKD